MPAPLDVDREAVKAHAITHGCAEAARAFHLDPPTVRQWAKRGEWFVNAGVTRTITVQPLPKSMQPTPVTRVTPSQAAAYSKAETLARTSRNMAVAADKGFKRAATMKGERIIAEAGQLHQLAKLAQVAHPELREDSAKGPLMSFTFHAGAPPPEAAPPAIDV